MGGEKRSGAPDLIATENWLHAMGRARRKRADRGRRESCPVMAEVFEAEAAVKLNLWMTVTSNIVASTKYPALRHADSRNNTIPPWYVRAPSIRMALGHSSTQIASSEECIPVLLAAKRCVAEYKITIPRLMEKPIVAARNASR